MKHTRLDGKVVVLGIDGGTWHILRRLALQGDMPNLSRAMRHYASGDLASCTPPYSAPGWTTITTGLNPGRHGIFDFYRVNNGITTPVSAYSTRAPRLWQLASDAGKRVHIFNVPVSYPPYPVNGTFVCGLLTPNVESNFTHPPELKDKLLAMPGGYDPDPSSHDPMWSEALDHSEFWIRQKERALLNIVGDDPWDLIFSVIQETDPLQHKFWFLMDEDDPRFDAGRAERYGEGIRRVYRRCDEVIGNRLELVERGATFILISDHGFGRYEKLFYINRVLERAGLLTRVRSRRRHINVTPMQIVHAARKADFLGLESRIPPALRGRLLSGLDSAIGSPIDWDKTTAYAGPSSAECVFVRASGADRTKVCDTVIDALLSARDPDTGGRIVESAHRREDVYSGPEVNSLPDIIIDFGDRPYLGSDRLASRGTVEPITPSSGGGRHRRTGILLVAGPDVAPQVIGDARIADVFPTVLHCLGLPVPDGLDGRVIECASQASVKYGPAVGAVQQETATDDIYSAEDKAAIEASLRGLGYVE